MSRTGATWFVEPTTVNELGDELDFAGAPRTVLEKNHGAFAAMEPHQVRMPTKITTSTTFIASANAPSSRVTRTSSSRRRVSVPTFAATVKIAAATKANQK